MKKFIYSLILVFTLGISTNTVSAANKNETKTEMTAEQKAQFDKLVNRVEEIRNMDKSNLTREEKRALRKELREIDYGEWEGMSVDQAKEAFGDDHLNWNMNPAKFAPTGGETAIQIADRFL